MPITAMHAKSEEAVPGISETPWGLRWDELIEQLRPSREKNQQIESVAEEVRIALARADIVPDRFLIGGAAGRGTHVGDDVTLDLYAVFSDGFEPQRYLDAHIRPFIAALSGDAASFVAIEERGLAAIFSVRGFDVRLFAAGDLYAGAKELLLDNDANGDAIHFDEKPAADGGGGANAFLNTRDVHIQTTCAVMRTDFLAAQPRMYKDMVRVARKWRDSQTFSRAEHEPPHLLLELLMLEAFQGASVLRAGADSYALIFRRFLTLVASRSADASLPGATDQPPTFLSWPTLYNRGAIDLAVSRRMLKARPADAHLCVIDPAVPFVDVADCVTNWAESRQFARDSLAHFQNTELVEVLRTKLNTFSVSVEDTLRHMREKIDALQSIEASPRRWSGKIQFTELQLTKDGWSRVHELELRCLKWCINVRRARSDTTGYARTADVSLQIMGLKERLQRTIDVDVHFQGQTAQLVYGPECDHVLIARRSEVLRNRDYNIQITIVA